MFNSKDFTFNGVSNDSFVDYDLWLVDLNSDILNSRGSIYSRTLTRETESVYNPVYTESIDDTEEVILNFTVVDKHGQLIPWDNAKIKEFTDLFITEDFVPFISQDNPDYIYYFMTTKINRKFTSDNKGVMEVTFKPFSNFAYKKEIYSYNISSSKTIIINNPSKYKYKPVIKIENLGDESTINKVNELEVTGLNNRDIVHIDNLMLTCIDANNINRFKDQSPTDTLANLNNTLGETGTNDFLLSLVQSGVNKTGGYDEILARSTFGGLTEDEYNMLKAYNQVLQDPDVANTMQQQQALESQNIMRNKVEEAMGGPPIDRLKAKVENFFQGTADVTETTFKSTGIGDFTTRILGNVTDYFAGKDTAFNNGYNNQAAVDYSSDNQDDVYKELFIKDNLYALDKNESKRLKDQIGSKQEDLKGVMYGSDMRNKTTLTLANTTSSKFAQFFGDDGGLSTKTLLKDIDKRDDLTEEEKEKLKSDINKSQAQTQNVVSATLDTATLIGGGELRSVLKDNVDLVGYGALTKLDDLSDINKISSLSLTEQRKIQQVLPEYLTKTLVTNYSESALNQKLTEAMVNNGFGENSELYQKVMADNKISEDEVKDIVTSIMNQTQQYSGTTTTTDDGTQQVADSSSKNAKLMGEVANNSKKQTEALEKIIEEQNKQIDSMEKKLAKIGVR